MRRIGALALATVMLPLVLGLRTAGGENEGSSRGPAGNIIWDESEILRRADISKPSKNTYRHDPSGCEIAVVWTNAAQVSLYADAGDSVVANPDRTAGVRISDPDETCRQALTDALADLR